MGIWRRFSRSKIVWPLVSNLIDILKNGAPVMLLAIGLTLVIATHGIDISVGSVVAISAGVVAMLIGGDLAGNPKYPVAFAMAAALLVCTAAGMVVVLGGTSLNGGRFFLLGSMVGALSIQTLTTTIYAFNVAPEIAQVVKALVVYAVSLLQSDVFRAKVAGMFGRREVAA
jgi:simple sugar transport system permease protein